MCRIKKKLNYITGMFPYNDEENSWISRSSTNSIKLQKHNLVYGLLFGLFAALLATTILPLIYFFRINLF